MSDDVTKTVGGQIRLAMNEKGETIRSVSEKTGINVASVHKVLHDKNCTTETLKQIAKCLQIPIIIYP